MKKQTIIAIILYFMFLNDAAAQKFIVSYTTQAHTGPFSGNIILYLSKNKQEPRGHLSWPCYRMNVKNITPGAAVVF